MKNFLIYGFSGFFENIQINIHQKSNSNYAENFSGNFMGVDRQKHKLLNCEEQRIR